MSQSDDDPTLSHRPGDAAPAQSASASSQAVGLDAFRKALADLKLIDPAELADVEARRQPTDAAALASALVREKKLTRYQAAALYQGKAKGLVLGDYLILEKIGAGGMGMVFQARNRTDGRIGALKVLPPSLTRDAASVQRFRREASAVAKLNHPNLVAGFETVDYQGVHYYVMEYVEGRDLHKIVQEQGPLSVGRAIDYLIQASRGLKAAHEAGIVHRDVKPSNLMLDDKGTIKVLDLGLARLTEDYTEQTVAKERITQTGMLMGTADYMAPEQADDSHRADHRADIYALGCTLYYLLTGQAPYSGAGASALRKVIAHLEAPIPYLQDRCPQAPQALEDLFRKMLAKKPEDRPFSAALVIVSLETCKSAVRPPSSSGQKTLIAYGADEPTARLKGAANPDRRDPSVFGDDRQAVRINPDLNLEDLLTDVRPDLNAPPPGKAIEPPPLPRQKAPRRRFSPEKARGLGALSGLLALAGCVAALLYFKPWLGTTEAEPPSAPTTTGPTAKKPEGDPGPAYTPLFSGDAKGIDGWVARNAEGGSAVSKHWEVKDGILHGKGGRSHLYSPRGDYKNVRVRAEMKINAGGNSGLYVRAGDAQPFPNGYEAQVNSTVNGPKTGSLYAAVGKAVATVDPSPTPADTWFTIEIEAIDNHIQIWVNGKLTADSVDPARLFNSGAIALQVHDDKTHVQVRRLEVIDLPSSGPASASASPAPASAPARKSLSPRAVGKRILDDDFSNPKSGWPADPPDVVAQPAEHHHYYADGLYRLDASVAGWWGWRTGHRFRDMDYRIRGRIVGDNPASKGSFGVQVIRVDESQGFQVVINGDGELWIHPAVRTFARHKGPPNIGPIRHKAIQPGGGGWNEVRLLLKGRKLDVWVNGERMAPTVELTWDPTPALAELTLFSDVPGCRAEFDWIEVYEVPGESADSGSPISRGLALAQQRKHAEAIPLLREAIRREPRDLQAHRALVDGLRNTNQVGPAVDAWRALSQIAKAPAPELANLAGYLYGNRRNQEAADAAREALRIEPTLHPAYSILGLALDRLHDRPGSIDAHRKGLLAQPNCGNCRNNLAWVLAADEDLARRRSNLPEALKLAREAVQIEPKNASNLQTLGVVEYRSGNLDAALAALRKAMDAKQGGDANEWLYLAMIDQKQGRTDSARDWLDKSRKWLQAQKPADIDDDLKRAEAEASALLAGKAPTEPDPPEPAKPSGPAAVKTVTNAIGMKLVLIQPGEFDMGAAASQTDPDSKRAQPRHPVRITRPFYLGQTEVTRGQYHKLRDKDPSKFRDGDDLPVEQVTWLEAAAYCNALSIRDKLEPFYQIDGDRVTTQGRLGEGYRLPTEAEWEYACRAGSVMPYAFGARGDSMGEHAWFDGNSDRKTHPVAGKKPNAWGLFDMHGNVYEWVHDRFDAEYYARSPRDDPAGPVKPPNHVIRGGSWKRSAAHGRATDRFDLDPHFRGDDLGFRVARNAPVKAVGGR